MPTHKAMPDGISRSCGALARGNEEIVILIVIICFVSLLYRCKSTR
jgi:hypothetical protein